MQNCTLSLEGSQAAEFQTFHGSFLAKLINLLLPLGTRVEQGIGIIDVTEFPNSWWVGVAFLR